MRHPHDGQGQRHLVVTLECCGDIEHLKCAEEGVDLFLHACPVASVRPGLSGSPLFDHLGEELGEEGPVAGERARDVEVVGDARKRIRLEGPGSEIDLSIDDPAAQPGQVRHLVRLPESVVRKRTDGPGQSRRRLASNVGPTPPGREPRGRHRLQRCAKNPDLFRDDRAFRYAARANELQLITDAFARASTLNRMNLAPRTTSRTTYIQLRDPLLVAALWVIITPRHERPAHDLRAVPLPRAWRAPPPTSLFNREDVGTLGHHAFAFVDWLEKAA